MPKHRDTIIIAEKDSASLRALQEFLVKEGFHVLKFSAQRPLLRAVCLHPANAVIILGDLGGLPLLRRLQTTGVNTPVIFLHSHSSIKKAVTAIRAGAEDYLTKQVCHDTLLQSIRRALEKSRGSLIKPKTNHSLLCKVATLTKRESEIIEMVLAGLLNKQIADKLRLALVTIKVHRGKAMHKLGARTAGELARLAREAGITPQTLSLTRIS